MRTETIIDTPESVAVGFVTGPSAEKTTSNQPHRPNKQSDQISFASELIRKAIHLGSLSIPIAYYYVHRTLALEVLLPLVVLSIAIDIGRHSIPVIHRLVEKIFASILRPHERRAGLLNGGTYVLLSALICVAVFPKIITITAFSILILSDGSSALFGRAFGKHTFFDKSLEGSLAFVVTAWLVVLIAPKAGPVPAEFVIGAIAALVGAIAEAASPTLRLDDNFSVPVSIGLTMWVGYWLLNVIDPARYSDLYRVLLHLS